MPIIRHTNKGAHSGASVTCWAAFCANRNRTGMTATASVCHGSWLSLSPGGHNRVNIG